MAAKDVKDDRKYTKDHEWALRQGSEILVGITAFAVDQLGDITLVSIDQKPGEPLVAHKAFGTIESVKTLSDLFAPLSGKLSRVNGALENGPELVNEDPWDKAWMIAITPDDPKDYDGLLDAEAYRKLLEEAAH
jgi:glycine cleavage system H protein